MNEKTPKATSRRLLDTTVLGHALHTWLALQNGQQDIVRFSGHTRRLGKRIRWQNGYDHACSVLFLCTHILIELRPYIQLDELLVTRCFQLHDIPEGFLHRDILAPSKKGSDDVDEYQAFRKQFEPLGRHIWLELQRCFLLQFILQDTACFPPEAREVMDDLRKDKMPEGWAFDGIQRLDYLFYAEECCEEKRSSIVLEDVAANQIPKLDLVAKNLTGFSRVAWTNERRDYFEKYAKR